MKPKVLIIEDNEQNMYMLTYLLESNNFEVIQSANGLDGISKAEKFKPDTILLDIHLPVMDGYAVTRELRKNKELAATTIIAVTSYAMMGDKEKILAAGATGYIEKPINPDTFISQIRTMIDKEL